MADEGKNSLNEKQERFCQEYIVDYANRKAAIRAGYSEHSAHAIAYELLQKPEVKQRIKELKMEQRKRVDIDADWITEGFKDIATGEEKASDILKALENLAKRLGYYEEDNKQKKNESSATINFTRRADE